MRLLLILAFFLFIAITFLNAGKNGTTKSANKICHGFPVAEMTPLQYKSELIRNSLTNNDNDDNQVIIKMALRPVWQAEAERIYVGYTSLETNDTTFLPAEKCIAVKVYENEAEFGYKNSIQILKRLKSNNDNDDNDKDGPNKFKHISELIDHGQITKGGISKERFVAIYELSDKTFENEFYFGKTYQKMSKQQITNLVKEFMKALKELHKVAIHLNFNPENLVVFFKRQRKGLNFLTAKEEPRLKLIGLEGAFFFGGRKNGKIKEDEIVGHERHNWLSNWSISARYVAPEYFDANVSKFSPKLDIWSAGLVVLEVLLANFYPTTYEDKLFPDDKRRTIKAKVDKIAEFYRGFPITKNDIKLAGTSQIATAPLTRNNDRKLHDIATGAWWTYYGEIVCNIVDLWCQHDLPEIAFLISNMMDNDPTKRMSAGEIVHFLDGECAPKIGKDMPLPFFGTFDVDFLLNALKAEIYRVNDIYEEYRVRRMAFLEKIQKMLKKVGKCQRSLLSMLAKRKRICAT